MTELIYNIANNKTRARATVTGGLTVGADIRPLVVMTSNAPLRDKVEEAMKSLQDAAGSRLLEIRLRKNAALETRLRNDEDVFALITTNYGMPGDMIMRWAVGADDGVQKLERVTGMLEDEFRRARTACGASNDERFYMHAIAVALVGARIGNEVGIWGIDIDALRSWACTALIADQRAQRIARSESPLTHLSDFINANLQQVVTLKSSRHMVESADASGAAVLRRGAKKLLHTEFIPMATHFRGRAVHGRIEQFYNDVESTLPGGKSRVEQAEARLLVNRNALRDYLRERNCPLDNFEQEALARGCMIPYRGDDNYSPVTPRPRVVLAQHYLENAPKVDVLVFDLAHPALAGTDPANSNSGDTVVS